MLLAGVINVSALIETSGALVTVSRMLTATVAVLSGATRTSRSTSSRIPADVVEAKRQATPSAKAKRWANDEGEPDISGDAPETVICMPNIGRPGAETARSAAVVWIVRIAAHAFV